MGDIYVISQKIDLKCGENLTPSFIVQ